MTIRLLTELVTHTFPLMGLLTAASRSWPIVSSSSESPPSTIRIEFSAGSSFGTTWFIMIFCVSTKLLDEHVLASVSGGMMEPLLVELLALPVPDDLLIVVALLAGFALLRMDATHLLTLVEKDFFPSEAESLRKK
jgi:hypothetical protein